jgi:aminopeptidase N
MEPSRTVRRTAIAGLLLVTLCSCSPGERTGGDGLVGAAPGVSIELARQRSAAIEDLRYDVALSIPERASEPVTGRITARFAIPKATDPLVLDFAQGPEHVLAVRSAGHPIDYSVENEHVVIPAGALEPGAQSISIDFVAGDGSLNRNDEFLYTLFVPDRARVAIPVFDQPDLKASLELALEVPQGWEAVANGPLVGRSAAATAGRAVLTFAETEPLPTYLIAFAAGRFDVLERQRDGRRLRMLHRETDAAKVERNVDAVFDLHFAALDWLEDYTGIGYPFAKLDFAAIPAFQYGGMEHAGAIFYRDRGLFLDETATQTQVLGRASLIAHEVAHMWFGNLVTMEWFDDVWMKEVFANFMAAKIVNPSFPEIDHELRFLLAHYPRAYEVDRTAGANPIRQRLDNLNEAGSLYGAIIYQKAPIVMKHLELLTGEEIFRDGLRHYLGVHRYGNASWPDLIEILDRLTEEDLAAWSAIWVEEAGRPTVEAALAVADDRISALEVSQEDPGGGGRIWNQRLEVLLGTDAGAGERFPLHLRGRSASLPDAAGAAKPAFVLVNGGGVGYGDFRLDPESRDWLLERLPSIDEPVARAVAWMSLWDGMLDGDIEPTALADLILRALPAEPDELLVNGILDPLGELYWRFLGSAERERVAPRLEDVLWRGVTASARPTLKGSYFAAYRDIAVTPSAVARLERIWSGGEPIEGLPLSENDTTALAHQLALRQGIDVETVLGRQRERIENPDNLARFDFVRPSLSADRSVRDAFFASLADPANREHEPWVLEAVALLHHPLRADSAREYIGPGLEMLPEIQATGDIFFPLGWASATLDGHSSPAAAAIVRELLEERTDLPPRLRGKLLQAADPLFRAARLRERGD